MELDLYFSHPAKVAELAEEQPEMGTFSLIRLGNVSGYKDTSQSLVEIEVPTADTVINPALCKACRKTLEGGYFGRYVLADLYSKESKELILIAEKSAVTLRCYEIRISKDRPDAWNVIIQGNLDQRKQ